MYKANNRQKYSKRKHCTPGEDWCNRKKEHD